MNNGAIPQGWTLKPLGRVVEIERESVQPAAISSGTNYVGLEHIDGEGEFVGVESVNNGDLASNKFSFSTRHVLYGKLRPYLKKIARPSFAGVCSTDILPLRPLGELSRDYLFHYLRQQHLVDLATARSTGANLPRLSPKQLEEFPVAYPPLPEQCRIAAILDKADAIRRKREEGIRLTEELLRSTFLEMFGDPATNPKGWDVVPLSHYGRVTTGNTPSRAQPEYYGDGIEWIKSDNLDPSEFIIGTARERLSKTGQQVVRVVPAGSTLVTCIAGSAGCIGNAAIADRPVAFNQQINAITPAEQIDPWFLLGLIRYSKSLIQAASTDSMKGLVSKSKFEEVQVLSLPVGLQSKFGEWFRKLVSSIRVRRNGLSETSNLYAALVQRAFQGQL
jgi:type I restriction enzyme, S subunit